MYKKLLDENIKNSGGINNFIFSLRKEIRFLKLILALLAVFVLYTLFDFSQNSLEPITTKQIPNLKKNIIAEIRIEDAIMPDLKREKMLDEIYKSKHIKGLLVVINSPGGDPASSEVIYSKLKKISSKMPVIAFVEGSGTSGSYMVAIGADKIIALRTSTIGSIGVISAGFNFTDLMKNLGISYYQYASSEYKGAGSPFLKPTDLQNEYRKDLIMQIFNVFKAMVQEARGLSPSELNKVANAKVFLAEEALKLKLIDEIGTKDLAVEIISAKLEEENMKNLEVREVIPEPYEKGFFDGFYSSVSKMLTKLQSRAESASIQAIVKH
jgi:protease-4